MKSHLLLDDLVLQIVLLYVHGEPEKAQDVDTEMRFDLFGDYDQQRVGPIEIHYEFLVYSQGSACFSLLFRFLLVLSEFSVDLVSNAVIFLRVFANASSFHLKFLHCYEVFRLVKIVGEIALFFQRLVEEPPSEKEDSSRLKIVNGFTIHLEWFHGPLKHYKI